MSGFIVVKLQWNDKYRINKFIGQKKATSFFEKSRQIYIFLNFMVIRKRFWIYALWSILLAPVSFQKAQDFR